MLFRCRETDKDQLRLNKRSTKYSGRNRFYASFFMRIAKYLFDNKYENFISFEWSSIRLHQSIACFRIFITILGCWGYQRWGTHYSTASADN